MTADLAIKEPCRVATTGNITLSGLQAIDGVTVSAGDRVLVRAQTTATENGIYVAASGAWSRATDFDGAGEVTGGTQVFVTSGDAFADSAWRESGNGAVTPGSDPIAFDPEFLQSGADAVPRSAALKLAEAPITPEDFGAAGDGDLPPGSATDDTAAVQAAMDEAVASGRPLYLRNMYMVTDTITWQKLGDSQGPIIYGDGHLTSGLKPYQIDGPVLRIDGTTDGITQTPYRFARGGHLHDFRIFPGFVNGEDRGEGFFDSGTDTTGIELIGFLFGSIERVEVQGLTGTAIAAPRRTDLESPAYAPSSYNSDGYQTQAMLFGCELLYNGGWGIDGDAGFGCVLALFDNNIFTNAKGGIRVGGGAWRIVRNSIAFNGGPDHGGGGILVDPINATPHTLEVLNNEIDSNYDYGLDLRAATSPRIMQNRFNASLTDAWAADEIVRPPVGVRAGFTEGYAVTALQAEQNEFRPVVSGSDPQSAFTAWQLDCGSGRFADADILKSRFTSTTANTTKYAKGGGARLSPTVTGGVVTGVSVIDGGQGYSDTVPIYAFDGGGTGFAATATLSGGVVTGATITSGGSGYSNTTTKLAVRPPELQGFNINDSLRIWDAGYPRNTGGQVSFLAQANSGSIAAASATLADKKVDFTLENGDFAEIFDVSADEVTIPFAGNYLVSVALRADLGGAGNVNLWVYVDGFEELKETHRVDAAGDNTFTLTGIVRCAAPGQKLTIHADNSTGSAKSLTSSYSCNRLSVALIG
jgi:hypothetical protein